MDKVIIEQYKGSLKFISLLKRDDEFNIFTLDRLRNDYKRLVINDSPKSDDFTVGDAIFNIKDDYYGCDNCVRIYFITDIKIVECEPLTTYENWGCISKAKNRKPKLKYIYTLLSYNKEKDEFCQFELESFRREKDCDASTSKREVYSDKSNLYNSWTRYVILDRGIINAEELYNNNRCEVLKKRKEEAIEREKWFKSSADITNAQYVYIMETISKLEKKIYDLEQRLSETENKAYCAYNHLFHYDV